MTVKNYRMLALASSALAWGLLPGAAQAQLAIQGEGASTTIPTYNAEFAAFPDTAHYTFQAYSTTSGEGQTAVTNNVGTAPPIGNGVPAGEAVDFGVTASYVSSSFVSTWNSTATGLPEAGPFIQIPTLGIAVAIPFQDAVIKSGAKLQLTDTDLCNIFSGAVTTWSGIPSAAGLGATAAFTLFYRADSSGLSYLLTQHLGAVCGTAPRGPDNVVFHATTAFAKQFPFYSTDVNGNTFVPGNLLPNFTAELGNAGLATGLQGAAEGLGYLSPDYTDLNPHSNSGFTTLKAADVVNATNGKAYSASAANTATGLQHPGAGSTNGAPPKGKANAANQLNWVPALPVTTEGYPIVGYDNWLIPQCFADTDIGSGLIEFLTDHYKGDFKTEIGNNGFVALQVASYVKAIEADFLGNSSKYNLDIDDPKVCNTSGDAGTYAGRPNHSGS